ncbi:hypothetical protein [Flammeovirga kamogawensis]|uniref:DUF2490 domain-containing protein n=1 Tax=Flammeovirga kamogawensis TaxID=373891 RepID=A0ABX8GR88_9BACT|nr:hypothetical protein [Flammeovirga kamogawensis]MBB6462736.1 hypothetical protein [Flammeovirga kamogawensis]QWG06031.1 hypothetical protein KM029_11730 [Flammeovirga kamogawensis]TRX67863.1 hypothetical protein EO216_06750 [Flammeovirga kamogawensis]
MNQNNSQRNFQPVLKFDNIKSVIRIKPNAKFIYPLIIIFYSLFVTNIYAQSKFKIFYQSKYEFGFSKVKVLERYRNRIGFSQQNLATYIGHDLSIFDKSENRERFKWKIDYTLYRRKANQIRIQNELNFDIHSNNSVGNITLYHLLDLKNGFSILNECYVYYLDNEVFNIGTVEWKPTFRWKRNIHKTQFYIALKPPILQINNTSNLEDRKLIVDGNSTELNFGLNKLIFKQVKFDIGYNFLYDFEDQFSGHKIIFCLKGTLN